MNRKNEKIFVVGIDEAGRGPLCGPVTAAAVVLPVGFKNERLTDSKKVSAIQRARLFDEIRDVAVHYSIVSVGARRIDRLNIRNATKLAMILAGQKVRERAMAEYPRARFIFLVDGNMSLAPTLPSEPIVKGDGKISAISAASILAKVSRDRLMELIEARTPGYGISSHKGYPTKAHRDHIALLGPTLFHRKSFAGVKEHLSLQPTFVSQ